MAPGLQLKPPQLLLASGPEIGVALRPVVPVVDHPFTAYKQPTQPRTDEVEVIVTSFVYFHRTAKPY